MFRREFITSTLLVLFGGKVADSIDITLDTSGVTWKNISGATAAKYKATSAMKGKKLRCVVTGHNAIGKASVATPASSKVT